MAGSDPRVVGITPAMREGSGLVEFSRRFPDRYFDVAIAEQHAVTLAAGMACEGFKPVVAIYSTFPAARLRSADSRRGAAEPAGDVRSRPSWPGRQRRRHPPGQLRPLLSALHSEHGASWRRPMRTSAGRCSTRRTTLAGPAAVRYPRGTGPGVPIVSEMSALPVGRAQMRREGRSGLAILVFGTLLESATQDRRAAGCDAGEHAFRQAAG